MSSKKEEKPRKLTARQYLFCQEYLVDLNATQAAIRAGYSERTARRTASANMTKQDIATEIAGLMKAQQKRVELNADAVLEHLKRLIDKAGTEVETETGTTLDNYSAYAKGIELAMKHNGMLLDRREITGKNGGAIELNDTERAARIKAILASAA